MRKLIFTFSVVFSALMANAQLSIGPIAGLSLSNIRNTFDFSVDYKPVLRYFAGVQVQYAFSERFSFGLTAQYAGKGFKAEPDASPSTKYRLDYFELLPFAEFKPAKAIGLILGVNFGYLKATSFNFDDKWVNFENGIIEKRDVGALAGVRYYFKNMYAGLSYNRGILPISNIELTNENGESIGKARQFNKSLQLGVGYNFHLKKK